MTRRRRPRTAQERVVGVLGTVAPGSLGGRIRNTRPAVVPKPNTGQSATGDFDPNENPVIIGAGATAGGGSSPSSPATGYAGSVAIGSGAVAGNAVSVAIGHNANADGDSRVAVGVAAQAVSDSATAVGESANAYGVQSVSVGSSSLTSGDSAVAVGVAQALGVEAIAVGAFAHARFDQSIAIGSAAVANATGQVMIGGNPTATGVKFYLSMNNAEGVVVKDTATGTLMRITIASGSVVVATA